jgi:hypothetical protein
MTASDCNLYKRSFTHRCQWTTIPGRIDFWGERDGLCSDGLDFVTVPSTLNRCP